jgi:hypothetical protein
MFQISFPKQQFVSPKNPVLHIEKAIDCDGSECGRSFHDREGHLIDLPIHYHLVESELGAWTRSYGVGGDLPANDNLSTNY